MAALYDGDGNRLFTMDYTGENNDRWDIWIPECGGNADKVDDSAKDAMKELADLVSWRERKDYTITEYVNDVTRENEEVLVELSPRGKVTTAYTYGYNRESADVNGDTQYYLYDGQGNVGRISSEWGRVKETYSYDPYGNLTYGIPDTVNYYGYNGESSNLATGLQYLRARYYNPQTGNFITEDTYAGQISNPLTLNRYDYVSNNPVNYIDPSGHFSVNRMSTDDRNNLTGKNRPSSQNRIQQALADKRPQIYPEPGLKDEKIREEIEKGAENYIELSYAVELQRQQAEEESRRAFCESLETREGQITAINILLTTFNLTGLALIGLGTGVGWIPFAFAAAGAVSGLITGAFEEAGTLEEKLYNATQGMVDGMLYWETLGVIGIAAPGLVSNPTGAMITEAAMETAVDILYAIKDNVTLAPGSMAWIFLTNIITTGGTSFKQLDEAWSYLKGAKNLDDFKLRVQKLIKGGSDTIGNIAKNLDTSDIPNMTKQEIIDSVPDDWSYTEHNGFVHIKDELGKIRIRIDPPDAKTPYPHVHIYDSEGNLLDILGNIVDRKSPDGHIPYKN